MKLFSYLINVSNPSYVLADNMQTALEFCNEKAERMASNGREERGVKPRVVEIKKKNTES